MKKALYTIWVVGCYLALAISVNAQDPYYIGINKTKGLPSNAVYDIYQDSKGFMWFATDEGLCRYDGKNVKTYTSPVLTSRSGTCIKEDKLGRIWYTNFDNKVYYLDNEELKDIKQNNSNGSFSKYHVMGNWLMIPQLYGVDVFDIRTMQLHETIRINDYTYSVGSENSFFFQDRYHNIFCIDTSLKVSGLGQSFMILIAAQNEAAYFSDKLNKTQKYISIGKNGEKNEVKFEFQEYINNICIIDDRTWICTKNGCFIKGTGQSTSFDHLFKNKYVSCVIKDKDGNYWVGTTNEGVMFIPSINNRFYTFPIAPSLLQVTGDQLMFAGKGNCLYKVDLNTNDLEMVFKEKNNHEVSCFFYDEVNKTILISSDLFYEIKNERISTSLGIAVKEISKIDHKYYSVPSSGVSGFYALKDNKNPSDWDQIHNKYPNNIFSGAIHSAFLRNVRGKATTYDQVHQLVYIAGNTGLYTISKSQIKEIKYNDKTIQARKVKSYNGNIIVLQNNGIILIINTRGDISEHPMMVKDEIVAINKIILRKNQLFIITNGKGVYYINLDSHTKDVRFIQEIPINEDVTDIEIWKNQFLVTCSGGLLMINMNKSLNVEPEPKLVINEIKINGRKVNLEKEKVFEYTENDLHINYSILAFNTGMGYPLYYRINRGTWKLTNSDNRDLELTSLKSDEYTIDFKLGNSEKYPLKTLKFTIKKPIWQIHWFWIGVIVVLLIIAYFIYKTRLKQLQARNRLLVEKIELEKNLNKSVLTSIKAQMNPHFFYNALNTIQSFIFADDKKNASTYLSKFSKLTRLILEMSEKEQIALSEEIMALGLYLDIEKIRFNNKLEYRITVDENLNPDLIKIPPMLIQPYVENSIKHGLLHKKDDCQLSIDFKRGANGITIIIDDNGIGRAKSAQLNLIKENKHQPFATNANQKRLEILNQDRKKQVVEFIDKTDEQGNSKGTTVIISLPLQL